MRITARCVPALLIAVSGCGTSDDAVADSAATIAMSDSTAGAPVRALRASDVAGVWQGFSISENGERQPQGWTTVIGGDSRSLLIFEARRDSIAYETTFDGDSMLGVSGPYDADGAPGGRQLRFRAVARLEGSKLAGTLLMVHPERPDSVLRRLRFEATRPR